MNFVYGIVCHRLTNPLIFLVNELLKSSNSIILIHVDKKSNLEKIQKCLPTHNNLHFIEDRVDVKWGGYSQIEATLKLLNKAQEFNYKYFSLLSGDDVPLVKIDEIEFCLSSNVGEYIEIDEMNLGSPSHTINRLRFKYPKFFFSKNKNLKSKIMCRLYSLVFRLGILNVDLKDFPKIYKGSNWFTLSNAAIDFIFEYLGENPNYDKLYQHSLCADEIYFHTILCNSKFIDKINLTCNSLRYIDWQSGPDFPKTLNENDFDKMRVSNKLFARKVDADIPLICLDSLIKKRA